MNEANELRRQAAAEPDADEQAATADALPNLVLDDSFVVTLAGIGSTPIGSAARIPASD